jgi:hypothetical protein
MDTTMELDDFKSAWQALDARLSRQDRLQLELLRERKLDNARRGLRSLVFGQWLQLLLGVGITVLGVACWSRNLDVPALFASGVLLHAFGVITAAMAGLTLGLVAMIDYSAPVVVIQKQMARLLRFHTVNSNVCGLPWWIMWVVVVLGFAGLGDVDRSLPTPAWIWLSLAVGIAGLLGTWAWTAWRARRGPVPDRDMADGCDGIRRGRRLLDEIARFEQE